MHPPPVSDPSLDLNYSTFFDAPPFAFAGLRQGDGQKMSFLECRGFGMGLWLTLGCHGERHKHPIAAYMTLSILGDGFYA